MMAMIKSTKTMITNTPWEWLPWSLKNDVIYDIHSFIPFLHRSTLALSRVGLWWSWLLLLLLLLFYTGAHWDFQGEGCSGREEPLQGDSFLLELLQHQEPYKVIRTYSIQRVILRFWYKVNLINKFQKMRVLNPVNYKLYASKFKRNIIPHLM